mmetsp:Transcript_13891/g.28556  ORF Transcript_13891/g.28556 Transcript_13891/m.28556 type:complete len:117 (-) Transcript_13891:878-1228(-)
MDGKLLFTNLGPVLRRTILFSAYTSNLQPLGSLQVDKLFPPLQGHFLHALMCHQSLEGGINLIVFVPVAMGFAYCITDTSILQYQAANWITAKAKVWRDSKQFDFARIVLPNQISC